MLKTFPARKLLWLVALVILLVFGYQARMRYYFSFPRVGVTMDEYSNAWMGLSWIRNGYPVGNSALRAYGQHDYRYINVDEIFFKTENDRQVIDKPWFDHPPMLGLVVGGYAYLKGARVFEDAVTVLIRKPMVWLGVLNIVLIFGLASLLFSELAGLIAAAIYTFSPYYIVSSRLVQGENGYTPFVLLALIFMYLFLKKGRKEALILAGVFSGVAMLFKVSAIYAVLALVVLMFINRGKKTAQEIVIFLVLALGLFMVYPISGLAIDWGLFIEVMRANADRFYGIGPAGLKQLLFSSHVLTDWEFGDGWKLTGVLGLVFLGSLKSFGKLEKGFVLAPFVCYLFTYVLFGSQPYGWYTFPVIPFVTIAAGAVISWTLKNNSWGMLGYFLLVLPIGINLEKLVKLREFQAYADWWRWGFVAGGIILAIGSMVNEAKIRWLIRPLLGSLLLAGLYLSWLRIAGLTQESWFSISG